MRRAAATLLIVLALTAAAHPRKRGARPAATPALLATCGDLKGKLFAVSPRHGWDNDRLPGSISFMRQGGRIVIQMGERPLAEPGLTVRMTHHAPDYSYFTLTGTYQQSRIDTWQVTFEPGGAGRLLWSSLSTHLPPTDATQGALYTGTCTR